MEEDRKEWVDFEVRLYTLVWKVPRPCAQVYLRYFIGKGSIGQSLQITYFVSLIGLPNSFKLTEKLRLDFVSVYQLLFVVNIFDQALKNSQLIEKYVGEGSYALLKQQSNMKLYFQNYSHQVFRQKGKGTFIHV